MERLRVAVLFGGISSEHEVSLISASSVIENLNRELYEVFPVGITREGRWLYFPGGTEKIRGGGWERDPAALTAFLSPDREIGGLVFPFGNQPAAVQPLDVVFPMLHGRFGEDGTVQGLLELSGIPYVGSDTLSSAVCMDKEVTNILLEQAGIPHAPWESFHLVHADEFGSRADRWEARFGYPMFVKPANAGSSVGVSKAKNRAELRDAVRLAFRHDKKAIIEKAVSGKELECAVLGGGTAGASAVSEIVPNNEFYDYGAKYETPSETHLPARIGEDLSGRVRRMAEKAFRVCGCGGMSRVDFLYEEATGSLFLNELNTIPGFTPISMYPKMMEYSGVPYPQLLDRLIGLARARGREDGR